MKLLVLGGTRFLGRHLVADAIRGGHEVTLFHRGSGGCSLFPGAEHIHGDRDRDLDRLSGRKWDVAVDTSGYVPRQVRESTRLLAEAVAHYTFVSTISVYAKPVPGMDESAPLCELEDPTVEEITGETYGGLKVLCERAAEEVMPGRILHVRSGLIVGPHDPTDRFTYWVRRVAVGGRTLAPGPRDRRLQFIHAADLGAWILRAAEARRTGAMNVTGPREPVSMETLLHTCREVSGSSADLVWIPETHLSEQKVSWWSEIPLCVEEEEQGLLSVNVERAFQAGLAVRPLPRTVRETLAWDMERGIGATLAAGLSSARESELLRGWNS